MKRIAYFIHGEHPDSSIIHNQGLFLYNSVLKEVSDLSIDFIILAHPYIYLKKKLEYKALICTYNTPGLNVRIVPFMWLPEKLESYNKWVTLTCNLINICTYLFFDYSKYDVIGCRSYVSSYYVLKSMALKRAKVNEFIFDPRSVYPLERWSFKFFKSKSLYLLWLKREKFILRRSQKLFSIGQGMTDYYSALDESPVIKEVPLLYRQLGGDNQVAATTIEKSNTITLLYGGSLNVGGHNNDAKHYILRCKEIVSSSLDVRFVFVIPNVTDEIRSVFQSEPEVHIRTRFFQGREQLAFWMKRADFGIYFLKEALDSNTRYGIKSAEYLMNGLPIIYDSGAGGIGSIIEEKGFGFQIDTISNLGPKLIKTYNRQAIREWANSKHSLSAVRSYLKEALEV